MSSRPFIFQVLPFQDRHDIFIINLDEGRANGNNLHIPRVWCLARPPFFNQESTTSHWYGTRMLTDKQCGQSYKITTLSWLSLHPVVFTDKLMMCAGNLNFKLDCCGISTCIFFVLLFIVIIFVFTWYSVMINELMCNKFYWKIFTLKKKER
jgi:hypothetical protein